jgi:hypothetical protein
MLKLEKTSQHSGLTVRLREQQGFFEPRLLKALAIALVLHCGALFFFHVIPFAISTTFIFPPVEVHSDHPLEGVTTFATSYLEDNEELLPPPVSIMTGLDWFLIQQPSILEPSPTLDPLALQSLEEKLWPKWQDPLFLKLEEPSIRLVISGELAHLPLIATDPLLNQMQPLSSTSSPAYVTYQVQLDEKTGELFWYDRLESSGLATIDHLTEKILLNLRFSNPESNERLQGTLNFVVLNSENETIFEN